MKLFSSSSKKPAPFKKHSSTNSSSHHSIDQRDEASHIPRSSGSSSPQKSPTKPPKNSKPSVPRPASHIDPGTSSGNTSSPRASTSKPLRHSVDGGLSRFASRRNKVDPDIHPLNLPPEERERKRLSALSKSAMSGRNSMDIDQEPVNGASPQTPKKQTNFSVPIPNGTSHDGAPAPPPHRSNPSSPVPTPEDDAESYKAAGNRFFKDKNYPKAIEQYSKGTVYYFGLPTREF